MAIAEQVIHDRYAIYNGDSCEVLPTLPDESVDMSVYSPPFADLYNYSSSPNDLSNCKTYDDFLTHYEFIVAQMARLTKPGRCSIVHCMDIPSGSTALRDFPGDIIRLHQKHGFLYHDRHAVWKEPLRVAIRTRSLGLMHRQIVKDSTLCRTALSDYILVFRKKGQNKVPVAHPTGLSTYAGSREVPPHLVAKYKDWENPKTNKLSHWIWQKYASAFWDDVRIDRVLPYKAAREKEGEKHVCPLQLDTIERCLTLWSNPGEIVLTPFLGVGSEVYGAVMLGRRGVGIELKASYFRQAKANIDEALNRTPEAQGSLFDGVAETAPEEWPENEGAEADAEPEPAADSSTDSES